MKKLLIALLIIGLTGWLVSFLTGYTQVIYLSGMSDKGKDQLFQAKAGDTLKVFKNLNFADGKWKAYLILDRNESKSFTSGFNRANCYVTGDINVLNGMKRHWNVIISGGDMTTVSNRLILTRNGKIKFMTGIVLDYLQQGLQSEEYGWAVPIEKEILLKYCEKFERVVSPVLIL